MASRLFLKFVLPVFGFLYCMQFAAGGESPSIQLAPFKQKLADAKNRLDKVESDLDAAESLNWEREAFLADLEKKLDERQLTNYVIEENPDCSEHGLDRGVEHGLDKGVEQELEREIQKLDDAEERLAMLENRMGEAESRFQNNYKILDELEGKLEEQLMIKYRNHRNCIGKEHLV